MKVKDSFINFIKKKSFIYIVFAFFIILFFSLFLFFIFNKKDDNIKNENIFSYNLPDYGIFSKIYYDKDVFDNFFEKESILFFDDVKNNIRFSLNYGLIDISTFNKSRYDLSKLDNFKYINNGNYKNFIYSDDVDNNYINGIWILKEDDIYYYVAYIVAYPLKNFESNYVLNNVFINQEFKTLMNNIVFKYDTNKYLNYITS